METDAIEQQILALQQQLAEKKASLERQGVASNEMPSDREIVHEAVGEQIQNQIPNYTPASSPPSAGPTPPAGGSPAGDTPSYLDPQLQPYVQDLLNIAFTGGLESAIKALGQLHNDALTDAFHDAITDEFIKQLTESGKLQKIPD